ncbi:hypothetical protein [Carnobacterium sp.]|uniref:hypothetical protein n=1 Tax=Carnobacterium sp. TaxID=48221 RepID=UPI003890C723
MTLLGEGDIPIAEILSKFPSDINTAIEHPCGKDPLAVLKEEVTKLITIKQVDAH